jgi:hypothetical protein
LLDLFVNDEAGVVHEHVQSSELGDGPLHDARARSLRVEVLVGSNGSPAGGLNLCDDGIGYRSVGALTPAPHTRVVDDNGCAACSERSRVSRPQPTAATRDEDDAAVEADHSASVSSA